VLQSSLLLLLHHLLPLKRNTDHLLVGSELLMALRLLGRLVDGGNDCPDGHCVS
jgi:hypothetical protein